MKEKDDDEDNDEIKLEISKSNKLMVNLYKTGKKIDSFEIIESEEKDEGSDDDDDFNFTQLSFKDVYSNSPLFKHVITHINEYLEKEKDNSKKDRVEDLSNFINNDSFSNEIINKILLNGIPEDLSCLRPLIWKALLGFFPLKELKNWENIENEKFDNYEKIKQKYADFPNNVNDEKGKNLIFAINKDLPRTRYDVKLFAEKYINNDKEINYDVLRRLLFYFANEHEIKYIQGMNELIAIIYYIYSIDDNPFSKKYIESDTYYTFEIIINEIKDILKMDNLDYSKLKISSQIKEINKILKKIEPEIMNHFDNIGLTIDSFLIRWILVLFAQEFTMENAILFWDRLFTQKNKMKFINYISASIIIKNKETLMKFDQTGILEWARDLQYKMNEDDITELVKIALQVQGKYKKKELNNIKVK